MTDDELREKSRGQTHPLEIFLVLVVVGITAWMLGRVYNEHVARFTAVEERLGVLEQRLSEERER